MTTRIEKVEVYKCPNGMYESTRERAIAWYLVHLLKDDNKVETVNLTGALEMVKKSIEVRMLLDEVRKVEL